MTEFEDIVIKPLINSGTIKFYKRYVDDTLILTKPSDIPYIFAKFNSFDPSIKFTIDDFNDNDIHFLDIQIHSTGTSVYRKPTHTGQYQHISSFFTLVTKSCLDTSSCQPCLQNLQYWNPPERWTPTYSKLHVLEWFPS